ncbi:MAG: pantoate--beta-alanine ligase [Dehalococcoidia bacterium]|nr:pantoate--beta-alanine ligase [Dehalococcoidia bacterium]
MRLEQLATVAQVRAWRRSQDANVALVPTMGYLHEGHLSLVREARGDGGKVIVSIFVNPTQFAASEDLARYPRDLQRDLRLLDAEGVAAVFLPTPEEIYPDGFQTTVSVGGVAAPLEGAARPGHFAGVATVVAKLFNIVEPDRAYFGQKDAQQLAVIRRMTSDLNLPVDVVGLPTMREPDGLAMSSRNAYLSPAEREAAPVLYRALQAGRLAYEGGERSGARLREAVAEALRSEPLVFVEYVSVADSASLRELEAAEGPLLLSLAARIGSTRLIDNILLP